jgi:hypothetical protein
MKADKPLCSFDDCKKYSDGNCNASKDRRESCEFRILAEKQTLKKVTHNMFGVAFCPICNGSVWQIKNESNFCFRCGQKLSQEDYGI